MTSRVRLFVTAAPDLEPEREAIGKAIAQLPVSLGWEIKRTSRQGEPLATTLAAVVDCDFYVFLLGTDVTAPVGVEWDAALEAGKTPFTFLKDVPHTPAAQAFVRFAERSGVRWTPFGDPQELGILAQHTLARWILDRAEAYGLSPIEWEALSALLEKQHQEKMGWGAEEEGQEPRGAGGGGVILAPGRDLPPGGVLVEETESR
jgi:hypothetical protein